MKTNKTKAGFLEQCSRPELFRKTLNAAGVSWKELVADIEDYRDPSSGSVPGMIYYHDTRRFAKANISELLRMLTDFNEETGSHLTPKGDELNWIAWFAWEMMIGELESYLY